jgi:hypothetical protein
VVVLVVHLEVVERPVHLEHLVHLELLELVELVVRLALQEQADKLAV